MKQTKLIVVVVLIIFYSLSFSNIITINPEEDEIIEQSDFFLMFSLFSLDDNQIDKNRIKIEIDGEEISSDIKLIGKSIAFFPSDKYLGRPDLEGDHRAKLSVLDLQGNIIAEKEISYSIIKNVEIKQISTTPTFEKMGKVYTSYNYDNSTENKNYRAEIGSYGNGYKGNWFYNYNLRIDSDEEQTKQTLNNFRITTGYSKIAKISIGDVSPTYHPHILKNTKIRGLEFNLATTKQALNLDVVFGSSKRAVSPYLYDSLGLINGINDSNLNNKIFSHNDSIRYFTSGTYAQSLLAGRLHFGSGKKFKLGLTMLKVRDDTSSIEQLKTVYNNVESFKGDTPKDNLVLGMDMSISFWDRKIKLFSNSAVGLITEDISTGTFTTEDLESITGSKDSLPINLKDYANKFIFNTSTNPIPIAIKDGEAVFDMKAVSNASTLDAGIKINIPIGSINEKFELVYKYWGPSYKTLAYYGFIGNRSGFEVKEELGLFNRKINIYAGLGMYQDNINGDLPESSKFSDLSLGVNAYWDASLPILNISFIKTTDLNNSTSLIQTINRDNQNKLLNTTISYSKMMQDINNTFIITYSNNSSSFSSTNYSLDMNMNFVNLNVISNFTKMPFSTRVSYTQNYTKSISNGNYISPGIGISWDFIPEIFTANADLQYNRIVSEQNNISAKTERTRIQLSSNYNLAKSHLFYLATGIAGGTGSFDSEFSFNYEFSY